MATSRATTLLFTKTESGSLLCCCLISVLLFLTTFIAESGRGQEDPNNGLDLFSKIYATKGTPISVDETYQILLKLSKLKPSEGDNGANWEILDSLVDAAENVCLEKCTQEYFSFANLLIKYTSYYTLNLVPYLKSARKRQFDLCQDLFVLQIEKTLKSFVDLKLYDIENLRKSVLSKTVQTTSLRGLIENVTASAIDKGVLSYLEQREQLKSVDFGEMIDVDFLNEKIMTNVGKHCFMIQAIFYNSPIVVIKELAIYDQEIDQTMNPFIREWLTNSIICEKIINDLPGITNGVYKLILNEKKGRLNFSSNRKSLLFFKWWNNERDHDEAPSEFH